MTALRDNAEVRRNVIALIVGAAITCACTSVGRCADGGMRAEMVERHGVTWRFDRACRVGTFVNGDPWVLGPVTIMEVDPAWDGEVNGTQVDPPVATAQGFRTDAKFFPPYKKELRTAFPLKLLGNCSVVSTIGMKPTRVGGSYEALETAAVLTVVDKVPPADAFRPPYIKGPKPIFTTGQICWDRLPTLKAPAGFEAPKTNPMERLWLDHSGLRGNSNGAIHPRKNLDPYYFFIDLSKLAVVLLVDYPERKPHLFSYMQYGIDSYYISIRNGDAWRAYGGFGNGRKWPILFTGLLLDNADMVHPPATCKTDFARTDTVDKFGEDGHTYYGRSTDEYPKGKPLWGQDGPPGRWFGNHDLRDPKGKIEPEQLPQGGGYRFICSRGWAGAALAARLMGAMDLWNHPAYFDYVDRWIKEQDAARNPEHNDYQHAHYCWGGEVVKKMWETYRPKADDIGTGSRARRKQTQQ